MVYLAGVTRYPPVVEMVDTYLQLAVKQISNNKYQTSEQIGHSLIF